MVNCSVSGFRADNDRENRYLRAGGGHQKRQSIRIVQEDQVTVYIPDRSSEPNMKIIEQYLGLSEDEEFYLFDEDDAFYRANMNP